MSRLPLMLVYRVKTGCRQYPFDSMEAFRKWTARRPYRNELIRVQVIGTDDRIAADSGCVSTEEARRFLETDPNAWRSIEGRTESAK